MAGLVRTSGYLVASLTALLAGLAVYPPYYPPPAGIRSAPLVGIGVSDATADIIGSVSLYLEESGGSILTVEAALAPPASHKKASVRITVFAPSDMAAELREEPSGAGSIFERASGGGGEDWNPGSNTFAYTGELRASTPSLPGGDPRTSFRLQVHLTGQPGVRMNPAYIRFFSTEVRPFLLTEFSSGAALLR